MTLPKIQNVYSLSLLLALLSSLYISKVISLSIFSLTVFNKVISYISSTVRLFCHILYSILRSLDLQNDFLIEYIKVHSMCSKV